ncbi:MAG: hypothetical protein BAJALOKI2v1_570001 [Promethearchaeota archaeon]|nr:MAG: hypothetical protein BAJALOKI2v1_570001 [Candidatus Lokiarchaeota archaeon]
MLLLVNIDIIHQFSLILEDYCRLITYNFKIDTILYQNCLKTAFKSVNRFKI